MSHYLLDSPSPFALSLSAVSVLCLSVFSASTSSPPPLSLDFLYFLLIIFSGTFCFFGVMFSLPAYSSFFCLSLSSLFEQLAFASSCSDFLQCFFVFHAYTVLHMRLHILHFSTPVYTLLHILYTFVTPFYTFFTRFSSVKSSHPKRVHCGLCANCTQLLY